tara:strand:- start:47 stop:607 length:561 start_codon:yes stop_codon:yes gene_type:complete
MTSFKAIQEINKVETLLSDAGLQDHVEITVETVLNQYDKKTPHIVAITKTDMDVKIIDGERKFVEAEHARYEELNKYFSAEMFAMGLTQRADYIKAPLSDKIFCYNNNIHPAKYEAPKVETGTFDEVTDRIRKRIEARHANGYQGKVDLYTQLVKDHMYNTRLKEKFQKKLNYFNSRQAEWLAKNN